MNRRQFVEGAASLGIAGVWAARATWSSSTSAVPTGATAV